MEKFGADHSFAGNNMDFEETGLSYVVRAGGIYNHVEIENSDGNIVSDTGYGLG